MQLLNVSFGIFAFLPQGWLFMILIILLEAWLMSRWLCKKRLDRRITGTAFLSNFVSGLTGIITTLILNGGWILVVWFPWVSTHEIHVAQALLDPTNHEIYPACQCRQLSPWQPHPLFILFHSPILTVLILNRE